jgi:hypothetical protein
MIEQPTPFFLIDAPAKLVASMARGIDPGLVIDHRAFDAKEYGRHTCEG